jgi:hypothetical protein
MMQRISSPAELPSPLAGGATTAASRSAVGTSRTQPALAALTSGAITMGILLMVYGLTLAPDLTWANGALDGGELITAAATLGVAHPPGYPTYIVLGKLFSLLPVGSVAFRLNLLSAVSVAAAGGLLAVVIRRVSPESRRPLLAAVAGGVTFGLLPVVWSQATVAEVYGLNLLFASALLLCLVPQPRPLAAGLFLGLALTAHPTSLLLIPLAVLLTPRSGRLKLALGTGLGLLPLLLLPLLAAGDSPVVWGDPRTPAGWWWLVSGALYRANLGLPTGDLFGLDRPHVWSAPLLVVGGLLAPIILTRRGHGPRQVVWGLGLTIAAYGMIALLYQTPDAFVLLLPGLLLATALLFTTITLPPVIMAAIPLALLVAGFNRQNLSADRAVRPMAEAVLDAAPADALILTPGDRTIFTLWHFHHVEGRRPDVVLVDTNLMAFDWYRARLSEQYPALLGLGSDDPAAFRSLNAARHPLCEAGLAAAPAQAAAPGYTYRLGADTDAPFLICQELNP